MHEPGQFPRGKLAQGLLMDPLGKPKIQIWSYLERLCRVLMLLKLGDSLGVGLSYWNS